MEVIRTEPQLVVTLTGFRQTATVASARTAVEQAAADAGLDAQMIKDMGIEISIGRAKTNALAFVQCLTSAATDMLYPLPEDEDAPLVPRRMEVGGLGVSVVHSLADNAEEVFCDVAVGRRFTASGYVFYVFQDAKGLMPLNSDAALEKCRTLFEAEMQSVHEGSGVRIPDDPCWVAPREGAQKALCSLLYKVHADVRIGPFSAYRFPQGKSIARFRNAGDVKRARLAGGVEVEIELAPLAAKDRPSFRFAGYRAPRRGEPNELLVKQAPGARAVPPPGAPPGGGTPGGDTQGQSAPSTRKGPTDIPHWRNRMIARVRFDADADAYVRGFDNAVEALGSAGRSPCGLFCFYYCGGDKTVAEAVCPPDKGCLRDNLRLTCVPCSLPPGDMPTAADLRQDADLAPFRPAPVTDRAPPRPTVVSNAELTVQHAVAASQFPHIAAAGGASPALQPNDEELLAGVGEQEAMDDEDL